MIDIVGLFKKLGDNLGKLTKPKTKPVKRGRKKVALIDVANVIAKIEGFNVTNSIAQRNNNPGNLVFVGQAGAVLGEGGFAKFPTVDDGFVALENQIVREANRGYDVTGFLNKYAPPSSNNTKAYIDNFTSMLGVNPSDRLSDILGLSNPGIIDASMMGDSSNNIDGGPTDGNINIMIGIAVVSGLAWLLFSNR